MLQHPVDQAKGLGFLGAHEVIPLAGGGDFFYALARILRENAIHPGLNDLQALQVNGHCCGGV